jgi:putative endonuclease
MSTNSHSNLGAGVLSQRFRSGAGVEITRSGLTGVYTERSMTGRERIMKDERAGEKLLSWGEGQALTYLQQLGMDLIERNCSVAGGEIDLIMEDADVLVFVEVKTRRSLRFGSPEESITNTKVGRIYQAALAYLDQFESDHRNWRIDVVAIECTAERRVRRLDHYPNIEVRKP